MLSNIRQISNKWFLLLLSLILKERKIILTFRCLEWRSQSRRSLVIFRKKKMPSMRRGYRWQMNLIYFGHQNMLCLKTKIPSIGSTGGVTGGKWFLYILITQICCVWNKIQYIGSTGGVTISKWFVLIYFGHQNMCFYSNPIYWFHRRVCRW